MTLKRRKSPPGPALLTRLEEMLLLAILRLEETASLVSLRDDLLRHAGKEWAFGSLYVSLSKLERRGLVRSRLGPPKGGRGGKAVKYYNLASEGVAVLEAAKELNDEMWRGFPVLVRKAASLEE